MRFDYIEEHVDPLPGEVGQQIIYVPQILVRVTGPAGTWLIPGILDTGSAETLLPRRYLERLGLDVGPRYNLTGAGGQEFPAWLGQVDLELFQGRRTHYRWSARVGFVVGRDRALWGHAGFLDHFTARFDGLEKVVDLRSNGTFPPPIHDVV
ncbi:MAG TPA: hypothetical protein VFT74_15955 [Isosphaeraceae bacterium]|nr:hypothetical protein [Isosphaeraceae bacterium]